MSSYRKRDDLAEGYLYRVVMRSDESEPWLHTNYDMYGAPRTYMTAGAARSIRGRMETAARRRGDAYEFAVQRAPVTDWEII